MKARATLIVCFAAFVLLGLPEGILGTAWPEIRGSFSLDVERLAWLSSVYAAGYLASSLVSGRVVTAFGLRRSAASAAAVAAVGLLIIAAAQSLTVLLVGQALMGFAVGGIDAALNAYMTLRHGPREMNALHGFFGVGAAAGPLIARGALSFDFSWRVLYLCIGILWAIAAIRFGGDDELDVDTRPAVDQETEPHRRDARVASALLLTYFALYVSAEVIVGQWSFSLLTEQRGVGENVAGVATAGFWGGLTVGRFGLAAIAARATPFVTLRVSLAVVVVSVLVIWADPFAGADVAAMAFAGLGMAGVFPSLVTATPKLVGRGRTANLVGYQLAASSAGFIVMPLVLGEFVASTSLEAMPPFVFALVVAQIATHVALERVPRQQP